MEARDDVRPDTTMVTPPVTTGPSCPQCGYNLTGLPEDRCPECGLVNAADPETARHFRVERYGRYKRIAFCVAAGLFILETLAEAVGGANAKGMQMLGSLAIGGAAYAWSLSDAVLHERRVGKWLAVLTFLMAPVGLFLYLAGQKRWRSVLKLLGFGVLVFAFAALAECLGFRLRHGYWGIPE